MAGAISGSTIASLIAMAVGAGLQYKANTDAQERATRETQAAIQRQQELQREAEQKSLGEAQKFNADDRAGTQEQVVQALTQEFIKPVENSAEMNASATTTQGDVSSDYTKAKAASDVNVMKSARTLAGLLGKTTGAGRLRQDEAIRFADTAGGIDRLNNFSRGQAGADQIGIQSAARPDAGMVLGGSLLQGLGSLGMGSGVSGAASGAGGTATSADGSGGMTDWFRRNGGNAPIRYG